MNEAERLLNDFTAEMQSVSRHLRATPKKVAMCLLLLHGRNDPDQDMDDTGYDGLILHGLRYCHVTYNNFLNIDTHCGPMHHVLTFHEDQLKLIISEDDAQFCGLADGDGTKEIIHGVACRVCYFGDWEFQLEHPDAP